MELSKDDIELTIKELKSRLLHLQIEIEGLEASKRYFERQLIIRFRERDPLCKKNKTGNGTNGSKKS